MKAIETRYAGCHFRSRLEARWAVFFDHLGIKWEYEPQGFDTTAGSYLPDFWLPDLELWIEVKGAAVDGAPDILKWEAFAEAEFARRPTWPSAAMLIGDIPNPNHVTESGPGHAGNFDWYRSPGIVVCGDCDYAWCICHCGKVGIQYEARSERICRHGDTDQGNNGNHPRLLAAYAAARSARFEHGESGFDPAAYRRSRGLSW